MDIMNPNIGKDPVAIAQLVVAPAAEVPLEGIDFLLDAIGFQNLAEHLCLIEAKLADYEDSVISSRRIYETWQKSSPSFSWHRVS